MTRYRSARAQTVPAGVAIVALIASLFVASIAAPSAAADGGDALTPWDVAALRSVTAAEVSPDGSRIAYLLSVPRDPSSDENGPAWHELHVVETAGETGAGRPYVAGAVDVKKIAWTPDGAGVTFLAKRDGDEADALYVIPVAGGEARRLVAAPTRITGYDLSPDGRRVAFLAQDPEPKEVEAQKDKGFDAEVFEEDLRPVKVWIAELPEGSLGTAPAAEPHAVPLDGSASELHWSPNGDRLALALAPTSSIDDEYMARRVRVVDPSTGAVTAAVDNPGKLGDVTWSPDGARLALVSAADLNDPRQGRLMVVSATAGGSPVDILPGYEGHVDEVAWLDAGRLLVLGDEGTGTTLSTIGVDGSGRSVVATGDGGGEGGEIWTSMSASGGALALVGESPRHPPELFRAALGTGAGGLAGLARLTASNPRLDEVRLAPQEVVRFQARDGLDLEGLLIHPRDQQPDRRYPLILTVHGGPESHYQNGWLTGYSAPGQVAAARGFAVFYVNYRGSTGRGVAFSKLSQGDPAGKEFDDLVDAVDHLIATGLVDRDRVGVTGGSYGGYATAWSSTRYTDRFAAGVMFVGISELIAKDGTSDIPNELHDVHLLEWPWEDWQLALERSPVRWVEQARTALLILGGKDDPRVHPSQSLLLYRYLKILGKTPVRLVRYPGEEHGNRKAAGRLDYNLRMMRWFEHYLQGPGGPPPPAEIDHRPPG